MYAALVGGTGMVLAGWLIPIQVAPMLTGYGVLFVLAGGYLWVAMAIRDRLGAAHATRERPLESQTLLGRRVF